MSYQKIAQKLMNRYPAVDDLRKKAQSRLPFVAWEYLETGTGDEKAIDRNREGLDKITIVPRFMKGDLKMDLSTELFGRSYQAPFGIAPVGLTGLIWPKTELFLAQTAKNMRFLFV